MRLSQVYHNCTSCYHSLGLGNHKKEGHEVDATDASDTAVDESCEVDLVVVVEEIVAENETDEVGPSVGLPSVTFVTVGAAAGIGIIAATGIVSEINDGDDYEMEVKKSSEEEDVELECDAPVIVSDFERILQRQRLTVMLPQIGVPTEI